MAIPTLDLTKSSTDLVLDLIYYYTGLRLYPTQCTLGKPMDMDPYREIDDDPNTFVNLTVIPSINDNYHGKNGVLYRRLRLSEVGITRVPSVSFPLTLSSLLDTINSHYGSALKTDDFVDFTLETETDAVILTAASSSLVWFDSTSISLSDEATLIDTVFLAGFTLGDINYALPAKQRLVALINKINNLDLILDADITLGMPTSFDGQTGFNTQVEVTILRSGYVTTQTVYYQRLDLSTITSIPSLNVKAVVIENVPFRVYDILDEINTATGLSLALSDLQDFRYTTDQSHYLIKADATQSYGWTGSVSLTALTANDDIYLGQVISGVNFNTPTSLTVNLDGFTVAFLTAA